MRKNQYNQVDDDFDHGVFFLGVPFGDHKGEGDKGVVGDALGAVLIIRMPLRTIVQYMIVTKPNQFLPTL